MNYGNSYGFEDDAWIRTRHIASFLSFHQTVSLFRPIANERRMPSVFELNPARVYPHHDEHRESYGCDWIASAWSVATYPP
jgi:hypothetical protein